MCYHTGINVGLEYEKEDGLGIEIWEASRWMRAKANENRWCHWGREMNSWKKWWIETWHRDYLLYGEGQRLKVSKRDWDGGVWKRRKIELRWVKKSMQINFRSLFHLAMGSFRKRFSHSSYNDASYIVGVQEMLAEWVSAFYC